MDRQPRSAQHRQLLVLVDLALVNLTTLLALWIHSVRGLVAFDRSYITEQIGWFLLVSLLWLLSAWVNGIYDPMTTNDWASVWLGLLRAAILVILAYVIIYFFFGVGNAMLRAVVAYQGAVSLITIGLWRTLYLAVQQRPGFATNVVIIGAGRAGQTIADEIRKSASRYYHVVGFVDDDLTKQGKPASPRDPSLCVIGTGRDLVRLAKEYEIREAILAISYGISTSMFQAILDCKEQGIQITQMPLLFEQLTGRVPIEHIGDNWTIALPLDSPEATGFYPIAKRLFDITGALIGLCVFLPLLPFIVLALRLDSAGPIFYTQERVGKGGKVFKLYKLRTMVIDAEKQGEALWAKTNDPRVTRVGRLLRKARLDEMPQLFNILKGDMSAVGPRPERPEYTANLDKQIPFHRLRNAVRPGMAGWAVVNYDYIDSIEDAKVRLQYDLYYLKHQSLWLDIVILLRMFGNVLSLKGR